MVCYSPLKGYRARRINPETKKRPIVFSPSQGFSDRPVLVPCGKCLGCLMSRSFYWSVRCCCESLYHSESYFVTLTYDDAHLPSDKNLCRSHFQSFMKRLRYYFSDVKIKVFYCGEYGEKRHRPHYHAIIFGLPLKSKNVYMFPVDSSRRGNLNYACPLLERIWKLGIVRVGTFSSGACSYVAQYTLKKHSPKMKRFLLTRDVKPFVGSSNRNAIGYDFFMQYHTEIYRRGFFKPFPDKDTIVRNVPYFNKLLEKHFPVEYFIYVELPRRRYYSDLYSRSYCSGSFGNVLLDRDSKKLYYSEKKLLRNLEPRDDF